MNAKYPPIVDIPVVSNATTVGHEAVGAITTSASYQDKTACVVFIKAQGGAFTAEVYRESGKSKGNFSCDYYARANGQWTLRTKAPQKFFLPTVPPNAVSVEVNGVQCHTLTPMTTQDKAVLQELMNLVGSTTQASASP